MADFTTDDMIGYAIEKKPEDFKAAFNDIMVDKIAAAIDAKKQEVASNYFNDEEASEEELETETEEEQDGQNA